MKKRYSIFGFFFASCVALHAQDLHFSQYNETPQLINPGSTGMYDGALRAIINYKNQWQSMGNAFNTMAASFDAPIVGKKANKAHLGLGLNFFNDKAGDAKVGLTVVAVSMSGILPVNRESSFSLGISVGGAQNKANYAALRWGDQYNGTGFDATINSNEPFAQPSSFYTDLSAGVNYEYYNGKNAMDRNEQKRLAIGVAYFHMNRPEQQYFSLTEKLYGKYVLNINGFFDISGTSVSIVPSFVAFLQGPSREYNIGALVRYRLKNSTKVTGFISESGISIGAHYRFKDAFIPQVNFEIVNFSIGVSYDLNMSSYSSVSRYNGGAEISLKYLISRGAKWQQK